MKAAVVTTYGEPPHYAEIADPQPQSPDEAVVEVLAAGLSPRVRSQANGSHYTSGGVLPLVPGVDGVGRAPDGTVRYFVLEESPRGSMAERVVVDLRRSAVLPDGVDPVQVAAAMNPGMSSWVALRRRTVMQPGQRVMVLGATGAAGSLAVRVARLLGAGSVVAVGRGADRMSGLGADTVVALDGDPHTVAESLGAAGRDVDIVLDYLWGQPTADALTAIVPRRADDSQQLTWVQIGSVAGPVSPIPSAALRATRLQIVGSGQGSVATRDIEAELGELGAAIATGALAVDAQAVPLAEVEAAWTDTSRPGIRLVMVP